MEQFPKNTIGETEKKSAISRVVGVGDADERGILDFFQRRFEGNSFDENFEKKKSLELESVIRKMSEDMRLFLQQYDIEALSISPDNIHIIDISKLNEEEQERLRASQRRTVMFYDSARQGIFSYVDYEEFGKMKFCQSLAHEMLHFNSFGSYERVSKREPLAEAGIAFRGVSESGEEKLIPFVPRRIGLNMISADGKKMFLNDFDEALVNELTVRFDRDFFGSFPELAEEFEARADFLKQVPDEEKTRTADWQYVSSVKTRQVADGKYIVVEGYSYKREMETFNQLLDDLYRENAEDFSSREELFALMVSAWSTGRILPFSRLVEKTYGKGSFRILSESTAERRSGR